MSFAPLTRVRVVSFTHFLQGPSATQFLADLGADVVKVEPPAGAFERAWTAPGTLVDGYSPFFACANRNVRSLCIDLKQPGAKAVIDGLLAEADVVIESFRPGVLDKLGFGYAEAKRLNPGIIYASLSGYGADGPYVKRPGQDMLIQAMSGLAQATGSADQPPTPAGASLVDQHAATLAALGILAALANRARTGEGCLVTSNLLAAALDLQIESLAYALNGLPGERSASGVGSRYYRAPYGVFPTSDGHIAISLTSSATLAQVFDDAWFTTIETDEEYALRDDVNDRIKAHVAKEATAHWEVLFERSAVWHAPVNTYAEVIEDPQVVHNDSFVTFPHPDGGRDIRVLKHPIAYDGERPGLRSAPPRLGEHNDAIAGELGLDAAALAAEGVLR